MPELDEFSNAFEDASELDNIKSILESNKNKNFVQRILEPNKYPSLPLPSEGEGVRGTHKMAYSTTDKGAIAYPQIIQDAKSGSLMELSPETALSHAIKTGEYIPFSKEADAAWFSKNYKKVWGQNGGQ